MPQIETLSPDLKITTTQQGSVMKIEVLAAQSLVISSASNGAPLKQVDLNFRIKDFYNYAQVVLSSEIASKGIILTTPVILDNYNPLKITLANISNEPFSLDKGKLLVTLLVC